MPISDINNALVYGFCRGMESVLMKKQVVPDVICILILNFYEREYFETINERYIKYYDKNVCQSICGSSARNNISNTSYGAISIPTNITNKCRYVWKFKISNYKRNDVIVIGIDEYHKWQALCCNFAGLNTRSNYGYCNDGYLKSNKNSMSKKATISSDYPLYYGNNDTITMTLNLIDNTLSYRKNKKYLGIKFVGIERGERLKYRLAVCISGAVTVTLIDTKIDR
eukprot:528474_1